MLHRSILILFACCFALLQLTGCASRETTPTVADEMRGAASGFQAQAERKEQLAAEWERGQSLIASGQKKMERGERRIQSAESELERGRREVSEGEAELREGRRLVAESERAYEQLRVPPSPASPTEW